MNGNIVTFNWSAPPTGTAPTGYTLLARVAAGSPVIATIPMGAGRTFTAAAPNGTYVVSVAATDMNGMGPESAAVTITVPQVSLPPGAPANLAASASGTTANFTWNAPTTGGAVNNYMLVAGLTPAFSVPYTTVPLGAATSFSVPGVPAGTYYVRVHAQNAGGTSPTSNEVPLTVAGPMLPSAPSLNTPVVSGSTVTLSWTAGAGGGAPSSYTLVASVTPGGTPIATVPLTGNSASFSGVPAGTYYLRLTASNAVGASPPSAQIALNVP